MKKLFLFLALLVAFIGEVNAQSCLFPFFRHNYVVVEGVSAEIPEMTPVDQEERFRIPETLSEANAFFRSFCPEGGEALLEELISLEESHDELAITPPQERRIRNGSEAEPSLGIRQATR